MIRLCSCGFGTDDDDWFECHLIEHPGHREMDLDRYLGLAIVVASPRRIVSGNERPDRTPLP